MNINVYLPDKMGREVKKAGLPLSSMLQEAITDRLHLTICPTRCQLTRPSRLRRRRGPRGDK